MWNTIIINPLSTLLHFFTDLTGDIGVGIVLFTIVVKLGLFYFNFSSNRTAKNIKKIQPHIEEINKKHKNNNMEKGIALSKVYKENKINPFSSILNLLIQIPILFGLYTIILSEVHNVGNHITYFNIDITKPSIILAVLTFISMYFLMRYSVVDMTVSESASQTQKDFQRIMAIQMKYFLPVLVFVSSIFLPAGITIYFVVSNLFGIAQLLIIRRILA